MQSTSRIKNRRSKANIYIIYEPPPLSLVSQVSEREKICCPDLKAALSLLRKCLVSQWALIFPQLLQPPPLLPEKTLSLPVLRSKLFAPANWWKIRKVWNLWKKLQQGRHRHGLFNIYISRMIRDIVKFNLNFVFSDDCNVFRCSMMFAVRPNRKHYVVCCIFFSFRDAFRFQPCEMFQIAPNSIYVNKFN